MLQAVVHDCTHVREAAPQSSASPPARVSILEVDPLAASAQQLRAGGGSDMASGFCPFLLASLVAAGPPPPPPPAPPPTIAANALPTAQCIDSTPAVVYANASTATAWVIQVGPGNGGAGMFCFTDASGTPLRHRETCRTERERERERERECVCACVVA